MQSHLIANSLANSPNAKSSDKKLTMDFYGDNLIDNCGQKSYAKDQRKFSGDYDNINNQSSDNQSTNSDCSTQIDENIVIDASPP